jgi:hypothetical protein
VLNDPASPFEGLNVPNLNDEGCFLRGAAVSGTEGGHDYFPTRPADAENLGPVFNAVTTEESPGAAPLPPYSTVVWVLRVK